MRKPLWILSCVACCKRKPLWTVSLIVGAAVAVGAACLLLRRGPAPAEAGWPSLPKVTPTLAWDVATGEGLPPATPSHSISLGSNTNAPAWGPGKVVVKAPGGRTFDYAPEALSTFEVTNVGLEVRLRFPKQPLAAAQAQARTFLADWRLNNEAAYLDRWFAKRSDPNNRTPSTVWSSTMGRVPAIVTLMQPNREEDQWAVVLQVFPRNVATK